MAGGIWTIQNKVRPGAYLRFTGTNSGSNMIGAARGISTMPLVMNWGEEKSFVELTYKDLADGAGLPLIGYEVDNEEALLFRECLKNCDKLLAYRVNGGGEKASLQMGGLKVTANYSGVRGNDIRVSVENSGEYYTVRTYLSNEEVDTQKVIEGSELIANDWVTFEGASLAAAVGGYLEGGTNGSANQSDYEAYLEKLVNEKWQVLGLPLDDTDIAETVFTFIKHMREDLGNKVQGVLYDHPCDYEGIITANQGYVTETYSVSPVEFISWVTGACAGAAVCESLTYKVIDGAVGVTPFYDGEKIEEMLKEGYFVLSRRTDGQFIVEQDRNSLINYGTEKASSMSKNRVIRTLDDIANGIATTFENYYIGKIDNNEAGRDLFKKDLLNYLTELESLNAIVAVDSSEDLVVLQGKDIDSVVVNLAVQPVDAMEKLYLTVEV